MAWGPLVKEVKGSIPDADISFLCEQDVVNCLVLG